MSERVVEPCGCVHEPCKQGTRITWCRWRDCRGVVRHAFGAIAEVFAARDALLASGWTEPPVIRVDVIADWDPVHDAWVMR